VRKLFWKIAVPTVILLAFGPLSAQSAKTSSDQNVSGAWTLSAEGYVLPMTLNQDGTRLTGTLEVTHGPFAILGEFKKGESTLREPRTAVEFGTTMTRTNSMSGQSVICNLTERSLARW